MAAPTNNSSIPFSGGLPPVQSSLEPSLSNSQQQNLSPDRISALKTRGVHVYLTPEEFKSLKMFIGHSTARAGNTLTKVKYIGSGLPELSGMKFYTNPENIYAISDRYMVTRVL